MRHQHGSYAGYQICRLGPEGSCEACKKACRDYMADYRARSPRTVAQEATKNNARHRALWRLADLYPDLFRALVAEELDRGRTVGRRSGSRAAS